MTTLRTVATYTALAMLASSPVARAADEEACQLTGTCKVDGAEVDDDETVTARKKAGVGPARGLASDFRIKGDAKVVGELPNGLKIYTFKFLWEDKVRVGLVAQDLLAREDTKSAVVILANGVHGIDYQALGLRMATEAEWTRDGVAALQATYKASEKDDSVVLDNRPGGKK